MKTIATGFVVFFLTLSLTVGQSGPPPIPAIPYLDSYSFGDTNWLSDLGYPPIAFTNLVSVPVWEGPALLLDTTNLAPAFLNYRVVETNGFTNLTFDAGALEYVFINTWASADTNQNGTGPGQLGYLLGAGDFTSNSPDGLWRVYVDSAGTNLYFGGVSNSTTNIFASAPISWPSNSIHLLGIMYDSNSTAMYLDGSLADSGGPVTIVPATNVWSNGFFVGSDSAGYEQGRAVYWDLECSDSNCFNIVWSNDFVGEFTRSWPYISNGYYTWLDGVGGGLGFFGGFSLPPDPTNSVNTNYTDYTNFWLKITNNSTNCTVRVENTLSNITYVVLTNGDMANTNGWGIWQVLLASNSITTCPTISPGSNTLFFQSVMVSHTGTNGLPDWWQLEYFNALNIDPYADPDSDGLCNLDEYMLGTNPTNAHSISTNHTDSQALFLAYTNDSACHYQISITNGDTNTLLVTMWPTGVGTNYQIYSHDQSDTNNTWIIETNFIGTNTSTTVPIYLNGRSLSLIGGYGEDDDGDGLSDGYEVLATWTDPFLPDTGMTGTNDGYKDPDGDGYSNLQEMYNGTNPHVFDTPADPQGVVVDYTSSNNTVLISWQPASGPVTSYIVSAYDQISEGWVTIATNSPTDLSLLLNNAADYMGGSGPDGIQLAVSAVYASGLSPGNQGFSTVNQVVAHAALAHGPGGKTYLLASALTTNVTGYNAEIVGQGIYFPESTSYDQSNSLYPGDFDFSTNIPASQFTNGIAVLPDALAPPYGQPYWDFLYPILQGKAAGNFVFATAPDEDNYLVSFANVPFVDGTAQMKQNVRFLLRAANSESFSYTINPELGDFSSDDFSVSYPQDYVYSSFYDISPTLPRGFFTDTALLDHFAPFQDNYFYRNFVFDDTRIAGNGALLKGFRAPGQPPGDGHSYNWQYTNIAFEFPTYDYIISSNQASIPGLLVSNQTPWVGYFMENVADFGASSSGGSLSLSGTATNVYGLPYTSLELTLSNSTGIQFATLSPGNNVSGYSNLPVYLGTAEPELETVGYYFARPVILPAPGYEYSGDPLPGYDEGYFSVTNETPTLMLGSVGNPMLIAGYAKQSVLNGNTNVIAYLGQYFTNAFVMSNGVVTTNPAGILSEYGEFFPTVPGPVALFTKPDPDQTNIQGQCEVDIIRLSLDVNHDSIMDETYTGPDNTGYNVPYVFWANNDYDRWQIDELGSDLSGEQIWYENDVDSNSVYAESPFTAEGQSAPDYDYRDIDGHRLIPCPRDLEDFARMWVSGVSNALQYLPAGSTVTLSWAGYGNSPTIDLFQAADADGGTGYLTNLTTASNQINTNLCQYIGRLGPGSNIVLNSSDFSNGWAGDHYIWCGVSQGADQLNLTITDGSGNILAQSSQTIQIEDIKQMYERWTVGDEDNNPALAMVNPLSNAVLVKDNQPNGPNPGGGYTYDPSIDTNDTYILYVHGWNMPDWERDRWAETAYKRLYWQGYQGRFGLFRWPCYHFSIFDLSLYDESEWIAWRTGASLNNFLTWLNSKYPGNVYVLAHSQGNVVTGEALRLATNKIVNTYVASQAAVSARTYDNAVPTNAAAYYTIKTSDPQGNYYASNSPPYFNASIGAGTYVNFFNSNDWALMGATLPLHPGWLKDQARKPEHTDIGNYYYTGPTSESPSGYYKQYFYYSNSLYFPTNTYEVFSMAAQSYSLALGAQTNVSGSFNTNLQISLSSISIDFGNTHVDHDEQFVSDNMTTGNYWNQLLRSFNLK